jgi:hypothetical protein
MLHACRSQILDYPDRVYRDKRTSLVSGEERRVL